MIETIFIIEIIDTSPEFCFSPAQTKEAFGLIPPRQKLRHQFLGKSGFKGVAEDGIGNEVYSAAPDIAVDMYYPVVVKTISNAQFPIQQKGGHVCFFQKEPSFPFTVFHFIYSGCILKFVIMKI